eukprot:Colp12_sorted_trinity150504_noHs@20065
MCYLSGGRTTSTMSYVILQEVTLHEEGSITSLTQELKCVLGKLREQRTLLEIKTRLPPSRSIRTTDPENTPLLGGEISTSALPSAILDNEQFEQTKILFKTMLDDEVHKLNTFFNAKIEEFKERKALLFARLEQLPPEPKGFERDEKERTTDSLSSLDAREYQRTARKKRREETFMRERLRREFSHLYGLLESLKNYQIINFTAFAKILKKHDKMVFSQQDGWADPREEARQLVARHERKRIRMVSMLRVGLCVGICIPLILGLLIKGLTVDLYKTHAQWKPVFFMFRSMFLPICFLWLFGVNVYVFTKFHINHVFIFELDATSALTYHQIFELAGVLSVLWSLGVMAAISDSPILLQPQYVPLAVLAAIVAFVLNPLPIFHRSARYWAVKRVCRVLTAPFGKVRFADFWLADQFNSMVVCFLDFEFLACYYLREAAGDDYAVCSSPSNYVRFALSMLPAWLRFLQCLRRYWSTGKAHPHLTNAGKYSTTFLVVIFSSLDAISRAQSGADWSTLRTWWVVAAAASSCYAYVWDVRMDWGLFSSNTNKSPLLRRELLYPPWFYYSCVVGDILFRLLWILTTSPQQFGISLQSDVFVSVIALAELFRRFVWNMVRVENEYLNDCGNFRADVNVPLPYSVLHDRH